MNYYSIPGTGIFGGIKTAAQLVDILNECGAPSCLVTPNGDAPQWFISKAPVMSEKEMNARLRPEDSVIFSLPSNYPEIKKVPAKIIYHCQGHDPAMFQIADDPDILLLAGWNLAKQELESHSGRKCLDTGIAISDVFFYSGTLKYPYRIACMPRRGAEIIQETENTLFNMEFQKMEKMHEKEVAHGLGSSNFYLGTALNEGFGLPSLEAMAAGCIVVTVPVLGGKEYLKDHETCFVVEPENFAKKLKEIVQDVDPSTLQRVRDGGRAMAGNYLMSRQKQKIKALLNSEAQGWLCP